MTERNERIEEYHITECHALPDSNSIIRVAVGIVHKTWNITIYLFIFSSDKQTEKSADAP